MPTSSTMTSVQRLSAALEGEPVDHVPFSPFLAYVWESFPAEIQAEGQLAFHHRIGADPLWRGAPCPVQAIAPEVEVVRSEEGNRTVEETITPVGKLRREWLRTREAGNQTSFLVRHPLHTPADYRVQMWIEENTQMVLDLDPVRAHLGGEGAEGLSIGMLVPRGKTAFQSLIEHYAGTEELQYALADFPETVEALLEIMSARNMEAARLALQAPYRYYLTWEDSGTQNYSPRQYDRFIGSEIGQWCEILAQVDKRYIQHACGHVRDLVSRMVRHGVRAIESVSPPPTGNITIGDVRAQVGSDCGIIGGIEPTAFLLLSEAELAPYTRRTIREGLGGPFILANSDSCPPGVTVAKYALVAEIARNWAP
jgi:hypothetical protein